MIIVRIIGGLGNQMFQYAAGRAASLMHKATLLLDVSDFATYRCHQGFVLNKVFSCPVAFAHSRDIRAVLGWRYKRITRMALSRSCLGFLRNRRYIVEPHFHYWEHFFSVPPPYYMDGYWQSARYFEKVADFIRKDFTFSEPLSGRNAELAEQIGAVNAVSLHVRRGDYVKNSKTKHVHGICTGEYYYAAIKYIAKLIDAPYFILFSDEPRVMQEELKIPYPHTVVDWNHGEASYNDMRLMSLCRHHIIANSSFSWWGAWLNPRPDKIVIAPRRWFANYAADTRDLYCPGWVVL